MGCGPGDFWDPGQDGVPAPGAGAGNVPSGGGALLAYNHVSVIDAVFVALPIVERGRAVHFFVLREDFERPIVGWGPSQDRPNPDPPQLR